jgi:hypothetical protein
LPIVYFRIQTVTKNFFKNNLSMSKHTSRHLRISSKHLANYKSVPELRLSGNWFKRLGFDIGTQVRITTRENLLIIEPLVDGDSRD